MTSPAYTPNLSGNTLKIVRYAMFVMLLIFGGIAYTQASHRTPDPDALASAATLTYVGYALCAGALVALGVIRGIRARAEVRQRMTFGLVGSAIAEGVALFGAVIMFMGGQPWVWLAGLLVFLLSWAVLPADPDAA
jgi:hypothetical protein